MKIQVFDTVKSKEMQHLTQTVTQLNQSCFCPDTQNILPS